MHKQRYRMAAMFVLLAFAMAMPPAMLAQSAGTGAITGTVKDQSGAVIPGAEVTVKNTRTAETRTISTTEAGRYSAPFLTPGTYQVTAKQSGFTDVVVTGIIVEVGQNVVIDVSMPVKAAEESITVTSETALVETEKFDVSTSINADQVQNLPLNGRRWDNLALLTPGAAEDGGFGLITFRGISALYNNNMVDGADNNQAFFSEARGRTRIAYGYSINSIKEFQVQTAAYTAEYGRAAGGVVNAVTKSGSNEWHGDAFYFIRDKAFIARDPVANGQCNPASPIFSVFCSKPDERRQQFGGAFSGPLLPEKLFFYLNYDSQRRNFPVTHVVNAANFFDFSGGTTASADVCDNPAGAIVNTTAQCQAALALIAPLANTVAARKGNQHLGLAKLDYQLNADHRISGVFNILRWNSPNGIQTAAVLRGLAPTSNGTDLVHNEFITVTWNAVLSPTLVNELKFQYGRDFEAQTPNASGPQIQIGNGTNFGMPNFLPRGRFPNEKRFQWVDNVGWIRGAHQVKFGFDINHVRDDIQNLFNGGGIYSYSGNDGLRRFVFDLNNPGSRNYNTFTQAADPVTGSGIGFFVTNDYNFYVQDTWKVAPNVTFNFGLRYEMQALPTPPNPNPLVPESAKLNTDTNNFGPRLGFAWGLGAQQKQVLRGGYGMYYGRTQNSTLFVHMFQNGVFQRTFNLNPTQAGSCAATAAGLTLPNVLFPLPSTAPPFNPIFGTGGPTPSTVFSSYQDFANQCPALAGGSVTLQTLDPEFVNPLVHQYDLAYETELPWRLGLTVNYLGSRGQRLPVFYDVNLPAPTGTATYLVFDGSGNPFSPVSQFTVPHFVVNASNPRPRAAAGVTGPLVMGKSIVNSWYNALVVRVRRREQRGFSFDANYTWSQSRDNGQVLGTSGTFFGTVNPLNPYDLKGEYGLSETDIRNRFISNIYWSLPFGNMTDSKGLKAVIDGWKLATVWKIQDGRPVSSGMVGRPSCAAAPGAAALASGSNAGGLTCGATSNTGGAIDGRVPFIPRNTNFTTPALINFDLRIARVFKITERSDVEFLWEAFNLFNRTHVLTVSSGLFDFVARNSTTPPTGTSLNCSTAGAAITNFNGCLVQRVPPHIAASSGHLSTSTTSNTLYGARQMQFGLKFRF